MSGTCQTPGCGHAKSEHRNGKSCYHPVTKDAWTGTWCDCTCYTAPTETVCGCERNPYNGDVRCHLDGEFVNVKCWKCGTPRRGGPCPNPVPIPTETVDEDYRWIDERQADAAWATRMACSCVCHSDKLMSVKHVVACCNEPPAVHIEIEKCGGRWNCVLPKGHNMGQADVPENHQPQEQHEEGCPLTMPLNISSCTCGLASETETVSEVCGSTPLTDLIEHAAGIIVESRKQPYTAPAHWAGALYEAGMLVAPGSVSPPTREQVFADAEAAWGPWATSKGLNPDTHGLFHATFIAGYLAAKGISQ